MAPGHATTSGMDSTRAHSRPRPSRPEATRIIGISGTFAFNGIMLLVLLAPLSRPDRMRLPDPPQVFEWITPKPVPPDPPPVEVEVVRPQPRPAAEVRPQVMPPVVEQVIVEHGSLPADPVVEPATLPDIEAAEAAASIEPAAPPAGARLEYRNAPAPRYPREALLAGIEGTVLLQVLVGADGRPVNVAVHRSSGHRALDEAARRQVLGHWRFQPAIRGGRAVPAVGIVPIEFNLGR